MARMSPLSEAAAVMVWASRAGSARHVSRSAAATRTRRLIGHRTKWRAPPSLPGRSMTGSMCGTAHAGHRAWVARGPDTTSPASASILRTSRSIRRHPWAVRIGSAASSTDQYASSLAMRVDPPSSQAVLAENAEVLVVHALEIACPRRNADVQHTTVSTILAPALHPDTNFIYCYLGAVEINRTQ